MKTVYLALLATLILNSCGKNAEEKSYDMNAVMSEPPPPPPPAAPGDGIFDESAAGKETTGGTTVPRSPDFPAERIKVAEKIKRTAYLSITVENYKKARIAIEKVINSGKAYIGSENEQNSAYSISNSMIIRVQNKGFDAMVNQLLTVASHVNSKSITAEDVTAQFVDIQSRLKSKKEIEKRYLDILQKASKVSDILEIEQKLGQIREEIEAKEGELKFLSDQVDYSTINLTFHEEFEYTPTDKPGFWGRLGNAFVNGWYGFLSFLVGLTYAWPAWILLGVAAYFLVKFIKRQVKK
jgi:hypothetical protein